MRPSPLRFKRKYAKPKLYRPAKKRKVNIAPDVVDKENQNKPPKKSSNKVIRGMLMLRAISS